MEKIHRGVPIPAGPAGGVDPQHMIGRLDKVIADSFGGLRIFPDDGGVTADITQWQ